MKYKLLLSLILLASGIFLLQIIFGYDNKITHPFLTEEIVKFYNLSFEKKLTDQEKEWIIQGAIDEDTPPRWINHFYDPISKESWTGENAGNFSKETMQEAATKLLSDNNLLSKGHPWRKRAI